MEDVVPDLWSILTCLIPGGDLSGPLSGTHLRLIIGCIAGTGAIIKPDSWGAGHEKKERHLGDACVIIHRMRVVKPRAA